MSDQPLTKEELDELEELKSRATQEPVWFGVAGDHTLGPDLGAYEDHERMIEWLAEAVRKGGKGPLWAVFIDEPELETNGRFVALALNGPTAEANTRYLTCIFNNAKRLIAAARERDSLAFAVERWKIEEKTTEEIIANLEREREELRGLLHELNAVYRDEQEPEALALSDATPGGLSARIRKALGEEA